MILLLLLSILCTMQQPIDNAVTIIVKTNCWYDWSYYYYNVCRSHYATIATVMDYITIVEAAIIANFGSASEVISFDTPNAFIINDVI